MNESVKVLLVAGAFFLVVVIVALVARCDLPPDPEPVSDVTIEETTPQYDTQDDVEEPPVKPVQEDTLPNTGGAR